MASIFGGCEFGKEQPDTKSAFPVLLATLKACSRSGNLEKGKQVHAEMKMCGHDCNIYVENTLINMYAKCESMEDARAVFDAMKHRSVVSWTMLILGYANTDQGHTSLDLFVKMRTEGCTPDSMTLVAALKACISLAVKGGTRAEHLGKAHEIQNISVENGCCNSYVQNSLIDMYSKCGSIVDARNVFDSMKCPDLVSWTALILGYAANEQGLRALDLFAKMRAEGPSPNSVTIIAALKACISFAEKGVSQWAECRNRGKEIHTFAVQIGCSTNNYVRSTLIDMYTKCGSMVDAQTVFDSMKYPDVVSWTTLLLGYAEYGHSRISLQLFTRMRINGLATDYIVFLAALKACTSLAVNEGANVWGECKDMGKAIYNLAIEDEYSLHISVQNSLIDMYVKCGCMVNAHEVFDNMKHPDVVSWTELVSGYAENGEGHTALDIFTRMRTEGPAPNSVTLGAVLKACGLVGAIEFGRKVHAEIDCANDVNVVLVNCLVNFYAKCGSMLEAQSVFDLHSATRNVITWTSLLAGFSSSGDNEAAFGLFEEMQDAGFQPNGVTFLCVLTCCSRAGLVQKGKMYFDAMSTKYGIIPTVEHYNVLIDLLGRSNKLDDAMELLDRMPCSPDVVTWMTILCACHKWNNAEIGSLAFKSLVDLNNSDDSVLMGQMPGCRGMLQEQEMVMGFKFK